MLEVIVDREDDDFYICRSEFDSPEVDPEVLVDKSIALTIGSMVKVRITEAYPFELTGTLEESDD